MVQTAVKQHVTDTRAETMSTLTCEVGYAGDARQHTHTQVNLLVLVLRMSAASMVDPFRSNQLYTASTLAVSAVTIADSGNTLVC